MMAAARTGRPKTGAGAPGARLGAARLAAVQALYQMEMRGTAADEVIAEFRAHRLGADIDGTEAVPPDPKLFGALVAGVAEQREALDLLIGGALPAGWPLQRLEILMRCILRAGAFELKSRLQSPARVVIDQYVAVAHAFFSGSEPGMVNGVLDALARRLRPDEMNAGGHGGRDPAG